MIIKIHGRYSLAVSVRIVAPTVNPRILDNCWEHRLIFQPIDAIFGRPGRIAVAVESMYRDNTDNHSACEVAEDCRFLLNSGIISLNQFLQTCGPNVDGERVLLCLLS